LHRNLSLVYSPGSVGEYDPGNLAKPDGIPRRFSAASSSWRFGWLTTPCSDNVYLSAVDIPLSQILSIERHKLLDAEKVLSRWRGLRDGEVHLGRKGQNEPG
jgi:hypothetical protein